MYFIEQYCTVLCITVRYCSEQFCTASWHDTLRACSYLCVCVCVFFFFSLFFFFCVVFSEPVTSLDDLDRPNQGRKKKKKHLFFPLSFFPPTRPSLAICSEPVTSLDDLDRPNQRVLVFLARHGLGNSLRSFVSAFVFAQLAGRRLVRLHAAEHAKAST